LGEDGGESDCPKKGAKQKGGEGVGNKMGGLDPVVVPDGKVTGQRRDPPKHAEKKQDTERSKGGRGQETVGRQFRRPGEWARKKVDGEGC